MLQAVELRIQPEVGKARIMDATPEAIESALNEMDALQFIICTEDSGRFMQDNGKALEYGENLEGRNTKLYRASTGSLRLHGSRPAFLSFLEGTDEWRERYRWDDVSDEVPTIWGTRLRMAAVVALLLGALWFVLAGIGLF